MTTRFILQLAERGDYQEGFVFISARCCNMTLPDLDFITCGKSPAAYAVYKVALRGVTALVLTCEVCLLQNVQFLDPAPKSFVEPRCGAGMARAFRCTRPLGHEGPHQ